MAVNGEESKPLSTTVLDLALHCPKRAALRHWSHDAASEHSPLPMLLIIVLERCALGHIVACMLLFP